MISIESMNTGLNNVVGNEKKEDGLGKNDFLKMLIAQIQNQDPLEPMGAMEFTSQLTQFESLEQMFDIKEGIEYLNLFQSSLINTQAINFIDKTIKATGNFIYLEDGAPQNINYILSGEAREVTVEIYDTSDRIIKLIHKNNQNSGEQTVEWDGTGQDGERVDDGKYYFKVSALDYDDDSLEVTPCIVGKVKSLLFNDGISYFMVGEELYPIGDIIQIKGIE